MLEDVIIIGAVMAIMEAIKKLVPDFPKELFFVPVLVLAAGLNAANAYFFGDPTTINAAVAEGLRNGAVASGVYGLGKAALGKS